MPKDTIQSIGVCVLGRTSKGLFRTTGNTQERVSEIQLDDGEENKTNTTVASVFIT